MHREVTCPECKDGQKMRLRFRIFLADNHVFERWVCVQCGCIEKLRRLNKAAVRLRQKKE